MILVTGATGYVGRSILPLLVASGEPVRILLRPHRTSPDLPRGMDLDVALASLSDPRGVRAAMVDVDTVVHLASAEREGSAASLTEVDVQGTENLCLAAADVGAEYFLYLSHLGASRSSAYPLLRAKAGAESHIRRSGVPHLILRAGLLFGAGDRFTCALAKSMAASPGFFPIPGDGRVPLQPLWIEDLVTALDWLLAAEDPLEGTFDIGGPEFLSLADVVQLVAQAAGLRRTVLNVRPPFLRAYVRLLQVLLPRPPLTVHAIDYLAAPRTASLDAMPRLAGLQPARMQSHLDYLGGTNWLRRFLSEQWQASRGRRT